MFSGTSAGELRGTPYARNNCVIASSGEYGSFAYATSFAGTSSQLISNTLLLDQISGLAERLGQGAAFGGQGVIADYFFLYKTH